MGKIDTRPLSPEFHPEWRITKTFSGIEVVGQVFTEDQAVIFDQLLTEVSGNGTVKAGGRRIRELIGCKTIDVSKYVAGDAADGLDAIDIVWIKPLIPILRQYPGEQKSKPDADFFTEGVDLRRLEQRANEVGLKTNNMIGTGNVEVLEIVGAKGSATLTDTESSWQTKEWWPKYAVKAPRVVGSDTTVYKLDCAWDSMYTYPLEIPGIALLEANDPRRVAVVGRTLLWQALSTDPSGHRLREPSLNTQREVVNTIEGFGKLLEKIAAEPRLAKDYAAGVRDMSLGLRMFVLNEPQTPYQVNIASAFRESIRK